MLRLLAHSTAIESREHISKKTGRSSLLIKWFILKPCSPVWSTMKTRAVGKILAVILLLPLNGQEPNPYIRPGAIGNPQVKEAQAKETEKVAGRTLEIMDWGGERVMFAPKSEGTKKYGYQSIKKRPAPGQSGIGSHGLPYETYVGKFATIKRVTKERIIHRIELETDDGEGLVGDAYLETLDGIVFVRDLDYAKEHYQGKPLWLMSADLLGVDEGGEHFSTIPAKRFSKVMVKAVAVGSFQDNPIRFVLNTSDGKEGYVDFQITGTNVSHSLRSEDSFSNHFAETDPVLKYKKWGAKALNAIADCRVYLGMTADQVLVSWGKPNKINASVGSWGRHEQWVYGDSSYLYFENGKLTSRQH
jgi:hypothetical protein